MLHIFIQVVGLVGLPVKFGVDLQHLTFAIFVFASLEQHFHVDHKHTFALGCLIFIDFVNFTYKSVHSQFDFLLNSIGL